MYEANKYIENFLETLSATRFAALNTVVAYRQDLHWLSDELAEHNSNFLQADKQSLANIFSSSKMSEFSVATRMRRIVTTRQFFQHLYFTQIRKDDPTIQLKSPKLAQNLPKILTEDQIDLLLTQAACEAQRQQTSPAKYIRALRLYTILTLLYGSGLRISELCSLPLNAVSNKQRNQHKFILIRGKGGKERIVPLNRESSEALTKWLELRAKKYPKTKNLYLFPAQSESQFIARQVVGRQIKALATRSGLAYSEISPHVLRHAFASHMLQHGSDLRVLQELLGHSNIATTQIYTHVQDNKLYSTIEEYHPLAKEQK